MAERINSMTMKKSGMIVITILLSTLLMFGVQMAFLGFKVAEVSMYSLFFDTLLFDVVVYLSLFASKKLNA